MSLGRVLIVEDDAAAAGDLRRGLAAAGYEVVGHAVDGQGAITQALTSKPDVVLMDVLLDGELDGVTTTRTITRSLDVAVIYVSANAADALVDYALRAGAEGYVVKPFQLPQVLTAIRVALHHHRTRQARPVNAGASDHFTAALEQIQAALADGCAWHTRRGDDGPIGRTTVREREIIRGLVAFRRLSVVAEVLGISVHTARNHLKSIFRKLRVHSQDELLLYLLDSSRTNDDERAL